jgi:hypothetical protein
MLHSRSTVRVESFSTSAICSLLRPAKKRSSSVNAHFPWIERLEASQRVVDGHYIPPRAAGNQSFVQSDLRRTASAAIALT